MVILRVKFPEPTYGHWDGGAEDGGDFEPEHYHNGDAHPGKNNTITWGCFRLNFWFNCGSGRSWREAASIARRRLVGLCKVPGATIEIVEKGGDGNENTE